MLYFDVIFWYFWSSYASQRELKRHMSKSNFQHQHITIFHRNSTQPLLFNAAEVIFSFKNDTQE